MSAPADLAGAVFLTSAAWTVRRPVLAVTAAAGSQDGNATAEAVVLQ